MTDPILSERTYDMGNERNYGIDLLRLVLMFMVCMLHTLGQGGVLTAASSADINKYEAFLFLEMFSYCAVDAFAIISGYMSSDRPLRKEKIVEMWFQVFFYSFIVTLILTVAGVNRDWDIFEIIKCVFPVTFGYFWYFTAFFVLFLATPILNKFIFSIDENTAKKAFIIFVVMFSVMGTIADPFISNYGYSAIWLMVLYCIGALAKKIRLFEKRRSITLLLIWILCIYITWVAGEIFAFKKLTSYVSPTIMISGMIMVVLFSRLKLKRTAAVAKLSPLAFGVYLFQNNHVIWDKAIKNAFTFAVSQNIFIGVFYVFDLALLIFVCGLAIEFARSRLAKLLKIPLLSKKLAVLVDKLIGKMTVLLK